MHFGHLGFNAIFISSVEFHSRNGIVIGDDNVNFLVKVPSNCSLVGHIESVHSKKNESKPEKNLGRKCHL